MRNGLEVHFYSPGLLRQESTAVLKQNILIVN